MESLRLTQSVYDSILRHATAMLPMEAVGLLGGHAKNYADDSLPLANCLGPFAFLADPFGQYKAERELKYRRLQLLGIYHSHPGGGAQLSPVDLIFASKRKCLHVVIALGRRPPMSDEVRAYRVIENSPVEVPVRIDP